jgi:hypothetical protein
MQEKNTTNSKLEDLKRKVFSVNKTSISNKSNSLYIQGLPFTLVTSGSSVELYSDVWNCKSIDKSFSVQNMNFVKKIKKYVIDNYVALKFIKTDYKNLDIQYIDVNKSIKEGNVYEKVCCIDIKNAYWQTALLMDIIDSEIYNEGLKKDKITRLASLGSLAKRKDYYSFDGNRYKHVNTVRSFETENLWFAICKKVSDVMQELVKIIGDDFIFYWVDGLYFVDTPENREKVSNYLNACSYEHKPEEVSKIEFFKDHFFVYSAQGHSSKRFGYTLGKKYGKKKISSLEQKRILKVANDLLKTKNK